jgi:hypothetical protein
MTASLNHAPAITGLQINMLATLARIDDALDRGDRRAFMVWAKRWRSLALRAENLLLKIATTEG